MQGNDRRLSGEQRTALHDFSVRGDRGRAGIFVGRKSELRLIRDRLGLLVERQGESTPGADLTTVIQGAPGAGKSALLEKIAENWPSGEKGMPAAIRVAAGSLELPLQGLLEIVSGKAGENTAIKQTLASFRSLSLGIAGMGGVTLDMDSAQATGKSLTPIILLFDEIQSVLLGNDLNPQTNLAKNIRLLHTGEHGAPIFPIYGGLANSADLLRCAGLTRLTMGSELTLPGFSDDEMDELMTRFVDKHLSSARPAQSTLKRWDMAFRRDSQGWPMHCRNFLIALCEEIRSKDWRPDAVNLDTARRHAQQLRFTYYTHRMQGGLQNRYVLIAKVLEEMRRMPPMPDNLVMAAIDRAYQDRPPGDFGLGSLPEGMTVRQTFEAMLHAGVVQKIGRDKFACPIPSLAGYIAAKATLPPSPLHEAVLDNGTTDMDHALALCRDDAERARLLRATDIRGRTPLILAVELGMVAMVKRLMEVESGLPKALRSLDIRDNSGSAARDHAAALGDERIEALLDELRTPEPDTVPQDDDDP